MRSRLVLDRTAVPDHAARAMIDLSPAFLAALRAGSPEALGACYREYGPPLLQVALRLTGERADAEDVRQDVLVGLPEALRCYEHRGAFAGWLRRLITTHALMRRRRERNCHEVSTSARQR